MKLRVEQSGNVTVIHVESNHLDAGNTTQFRNAVSEAIAGRQGVLIDLTDVQFVDSSGLGALLSCLRQISADGGRLRLCGISRTVRSLFELVRMHRVFEIHGSREEALAAFASETSDDTDAAPPSEEAP